MGKFFNYFPDQMTAIFMRVGMWWHRRVSSGMTRDIPIQPTNHMKIRVQGLMIIAGSFLGFLAIRFVQAKTTSPALASQPIGAYFLAIPAMVGLLQLLTGSPWEQLLERWNAMPPKRQKLWAAVVLLTLVAILGAIAFWSIHRQIPTGQHAGPGALP